MVIISVCNVFSSKRVKSISKLEEPNVSQDTITSNDIDLYVNMRVSVCLLSMNSMTLCY